MAWKFPWTFPLVSKAVSGLGTTFFSTRPQVCNIPACQGTTLLPKSKNFDFIFLKILSSPPPQIFSKYVSSILNWLYSTSGHITSIFEPFPGSFGQNWKIEKCFHFEESSTALGAPVCRLRRQPDAPGSPALSPRSPSTRTEVKCSYLSVGYPRACLRWVLDSKFCPTTFYLPKLK